MRAREFAARAGISPHVVRYYTRIGLLRAPDGSPRDPDICPLIAAAEA